MACALTVTKVAQRGWEYCDFFVNIFHFHDESQKPAHSYIFVNIFHFQDESQKPAQVWPLV